MGLIQGLGHGAFNFLPGLWIEEQVNRAYPLALSGGEVGLEDSWLPA